MDAHSIALKSFTLVLFVLSLGKAFVDRRSSAALSDLVITFVMIAVIVEQAAQGQTTARYWRGVKLASFITAVALLVASGWMAR